MKKSKFMKLLAVILAISVTMASFGAVTAGASCAYPITGSDNPVMVIISDILDTLIRFITNMFSGLFNDGPGFVDSGAPQIDKLIESNYYQGIGKEFATTAATDAKWNIGYSNASLIPNDYSNGTYYIGGFISAENGLTNVVEGIAEIPGFGPDDMKVRAMAVNDGTGKGTVLFATIDSIGITNADIKDIRALLTSFAAAHNIVSINISATHAHSCIDTEGLWTKNLTKLLINGLNNGLDTAEDLVPGTNPAYMAFLKEKVADTLIRAFYDLKPGTLTYAIKDIGQDYFQNKNRPSSGQMVFEINEKGDMVFNGETQIAMTDINRFIFTPDDATAKPTMMLNMAAHPDVAGLPTESNSGREISGDYIFYCGQFLEKYGYNFMFWQGAIAGIYMGRSATNDGVEMAQRVQQSQRYGYEIARMALSLTKTKDEIIADPQLSNAAEAQAEADKGNTDYTVWYENWEPVTEVQVEPYLNLYIKQVIVPVSNGVIEAVGKLNLANYVVISNPDGTYATAVEIGYMEMGSCFKTVFVPGEICQDLIAPYGISLEASKSVTAQSFNGSPACAIFGDDVQCFGLMNDAIGYIVPDNDFTMGDPINNHYHEIISLGQGVSTAIMYGFAELNSEIVRV